MESPLELCKCHTLPLLSNININNQYEMSSKNPHLLRLCDDVMPSDTKNRTTFLLNSHIHYSHIKTKSHTHYSILSLADLNTQTLTKPSQTCRFIYRFGMFSTRLILRMYHTVSYTKVVCHILIWLCRIESSLNGSIIYANYRCWLYIICIFIPCSPIIKWLE